MPCPRHHGMQATVPGAVVRDHEARVPPFPARVGEPARRFQSRALCLHPCSGHPPATSKRCKNKHCPAGAAFLHHTPHSQLEFEFHIMLYIVGKCLQVNIPRKSLYNSFHSPPPRHRGGGWYGSMYVSVGSLLSWRKF
jgi:hypothetical protein